MSLLSRLLSGTSSFCINDGFASGDPIKTGGLTELVADLHKACTSASGMLVDYPAAEARLGQAREHLYSGLQAFEPASLSSREQALTFWMNLYNLLILDAVLTFRVSKSVVGLTRGFLRFFEKAAYRIGGQRFSANDIENGILRNNQGHPVGNGWQFMDSDPRLQLVVTPMEPRVHFGLNCASHSCPPFREFAVEQLEQQLDLSTKSFVDAETRFEADPPQLILSKIFKWYPRDFDSSRRHCAIHSGTLAHPRYAPRILEARKEQPALAIQPLQLEIKSATVSLLLGQSHMHLTRN